MDPFATERRVFETRKLDLLDAHEGQYAVVHGEDLLGIRPSLEAAVEFGYRTTRAAAFLVKRIERRDVPIFLPAWVL